MTGATVAAHDLVVQYDDLRALDGVSLTAVPGQVLAVTGASGAGKTTLLSALAGLSLLRSGHVELDGSRVSGRPASLAQGVVLVPQGNGLASVLTARENVLVPLLATGHPPQGARRTADDALARLGLLESAEHLVDELSGGQQQRVALARGLALGARVLLADEPTSELDHTNRERVMALLREEADRGVTVVVTTHDPEVADPADVQVHLDEGRLSRVR